MFIDTYAILFAIIAIVVGILITFFGLKLLIPTLFLVGFFSVVVLIFGFFYLIILPHDHVIWVGWVILGVSFIYGTLFGIFTVKLTRVGLFLIGLWLGFVIGLTIYNAFLYKLPHSDVLMN